MKRSEDKVDQLIRSLAVIDENIRAEAIAGNAVYRGVKVPGRMYARENAGGSGVRSVQQ